MRKLKPQAYLDEVYPDAGYTTKTVINWIKARKIRGEQTVTGRWLVVLENKAKSNVNILVELLEAEV